MDMKYEIIIFWGSEDNDYFAQVPELAKLYGRRHMAATKREKQALAR